MEKRRNGFYFDIFLKNSNQKFFLDSVFITQSEIEKLLYLLEDYLQAYADEFEFVTRLKFGERKSDSIKDAFNRCKNKAKTLIQEEQSLENQ